MIEEAFAAPLTGALCAQLAIVLTCVVESGGRLASVSLLVLLGGVLAAGLITSLVATAAALRAPLLRALRAE